MLFLLHPLPAPGRAVELEAGRTSERRLVDIQQRIGELLKVVQEKTVSRKISALTNYFQWLMKEKALQVNPAETIRSLRVTSPLPDILFEEELSGCKF